MARLYTSKRGRSSSTRPVSKKPPSWMKLTQEEVEGLVVKLAREGNTPSQIGMILRDRYGLPLVKPITQAKISAVLESSGQPLKIPEDLGSLIKKADAIRKHLERNTKDYQTKRGLAMIESKIHRLTKYYKRSGVLGNDWEYRPMAASMA